MKKRIFFAAVVMCVAVCMCFMACTPTEKTYKVTFNPGFEGVEYSYKEVKEGEPFTLEQAPTRNGYKFLGWSDGADIYDAGAEYTLSEGKDFTFVGQWEKEEPTPSGPDEPGPDKPAKKEVTATFLDGDGKIMYSEKVEEGGNAHGPASNPLHKYDWCYEFAGWDNETENLKEDTTFAPLFTYKPTELDCFIYEPNEDNSGYIIDMEESASEVYGYSGDIAIPAEHNGKPVTEIKFINFRSSRGKCYIPGSVKKLGEGHPDSFPVPYGALGGSAFTDIIFDEGVEYISDGALEYVGIQENYELNVKFVENIYFPSTLEYLGDYITSGLRNVHISEGANVSLNNGILLTDNGQRILCVLYTGEDLDLVIPFGVTEIKPGLCYMRTDIVSLRIDAKIKKIGVQAFMYCYRLKKITFGPNAMVEELEYDCFRSCGTSQYNSQFTEPVIFPDGLKKIGVAAFWDSEVGTIKIPDSVEEIGEGFVNNTGIRELNLEMTGADVSKNGKYSLKNGVLIEKGTSEYTLADGTKGDRLMIYASGNQALSYTTPETVRSFDCFSFANQVHLQDLIVNEGVKVIPYAFAFCANGGGEIPDYSESSLKKVSLPSTLEKIEDQFPPLDDGGYGFAGINMYGLHTSFYGNGNLTEFIIDEDAPIKELPDLVCFNTDVRTFRLPKNIEAFEICPFGKSFEKYEVAEGNTHFKTDSEGILYNYEMTELISIPRGYKSDKWTAPANLKKVAVDAVYGVYNLSELDFSLSSLTEVGHYAFELMYTAEYDENWMPKPESLKGLTKVTFPATLEKMGVGVFSNDNLLEEVIFMGNVPELATNTEETQLFPSNGKLTITVPEDKVNDYYCALYNYSYDSTYANMLNRDGLRYTTFKFDTKGGSMDEAILNDGIYDCLLTQYPLPEKDGLYFQGWYTKDGTESEAWGELVLPPYRNEGESDTVTLYAKYGKEKWETGAYYAPYTYEKDKVYNVNLLDRNLQYMDAFTYSKYPVIWFEYVAEEDMSWFNLTASFPDVQDASNYYVAGGVFLKCEYDFFSQEYSLTKGQKYYIGILICDTENFSSGQVNIKLTIERGE